MYPTLTPIITQPTTVSTVHNQIAAVHITPAHAMLANFTKESARKLAEDVRTAVKGLGTDDRLLIEALCPLTNEQRYVVANQYAGIYGRSLKEDIRSDISGDYRRLILGSCMPRIAYMASECHRATKGLGTDEDALIDILSHTDTQIRSALSQNFDLMYKKPLYDWIKGDTSFNFKKALLASMQECTPGNPTQDARSLYDAGEKKLGTDDSTFINIICRRTPKQIREIVAEYSKISKKSLYEAIKSETSGDYQKFLCAIVTPWHDYWAKRIYQCVHGLGTDDKGLIRAFCMNDRYTFPEIMRIYQGKYNKSMSKAIADDTSFNYKKALLKMIDL